jgi:predicted RNase H-like HicB family nuclease
MNEILFLVEPDPEGGYTAQAMQEAIFTQADDLISLRQEIKDAVHCHFPDASQRPQIIRLHIVQEEVFAS